MTGKPFPDCLARPPATSKTVHRHLACPTLTIVRRHQPEIARFGGESWPSSWLCNSGSGITITMRAMFSLKRLCLRTFPVVGFWSRRSHSAGYVLMTVAVHEGRFRCRCHGSGACGEQGLMRRWDCLQEEKGGVDGCLAPDGLVQLLAVLEMQGHPKEVSHSDAVVNM
ncbi:hypothetical protein EI94DRAFT_1890240 [Lactarius quietus]|nr:hypothetical protein EI94DRAFT_1890240 [Lactarius quietus]